MSKVDETPELDGEAALLPPSVPVANNVAMKLPVLWDAQYAIIVLTVSKTKFYHAVVAFPRMLLLRSHPCST